jgi:NAD(P)-dependent dehydrogenase (short-subunit alcohol dehydrogenase family)
MSQSIGERVVIVTGATSGIGRACAERFAAGGDAVVIAARRRRLGEALAAQLGPRARFVETDVTRPDDIARLVDETQDRLGGIDVFVSNAGAGSTTGPIAATDLAELERDISLHVYAPFLAIRRAAPAMAAAGRGAFINISSISARYAGFNSFGYEVAKAALTHLTRCAALELGEFGIRVNSVSPGPTLTGIFGKHVGVDPDAADAQAGAIEAAFLRMLPQVQATPGMARAQDIAAAVWFLASDAARFVNGHDLVVDGGITAGRPAKAMREGWRALAEAVSAGGVA